MEKEEKTGKEPKKVPTKLAIGLIGGTAAIIVGGFAIAYIIFTDKPQENSQEPIQANYVVGNVKRKLHLLQGGVLALFRTLHQTVVILDKSRNRIGNFANILFATVVIIQRSESGSGFVK